jgi:hypothetical protein
MYECDERLKAKAEGCTRLTYTVNAQKLLVKKKIVNAARR